MRFGRQSHGVLLASGQYTITRLDIPGKTAGHVSARAKLRPPDLALYPAAVATALSQARDRLNSRTPRDSAALGAMTQTLIVTVLVALPPHDGVERIADRDGELRRAPQRRRHLARTDPVEAAWKPQRVQIVCVSVGCAARGTTYGETNHLSGMLTVPDRDETTDSNRRQ